MMVKKLLLKEWKLHLPMKIALLLLIEIIVKLLLEETPHIEYLQRWYKRRLDQVQVKEDLCIITTLKITSMEVMVSSVPNFQLVLVSALL
jgi:hypothetical protein